MIYYKNNLLEVINEGVENAEKYDFKDWIIINNEEEIFLKKWIRYKAGEYPDADEILKIKDAEGCVIEKLGWYKSEDKLNSRYLDCIFSMATFFNSFIRYYAKDHEIFKNGKSLYYGQLIDNYDSLFSESYKRTFCSSNTISEDKLDSLFKQMNFFARNTHTIGNYMPCPDNLYNSLKGGARGINKGYQYFRDRLELLYLELQKPAHEEYLADKRQIWIKWFEDNKVSLILEDILDNKQLLEFSFNGNIMSKEDIEPYINYLICVNGIIEKRGKELVKKFCCSQLPSFI